jgi:2-amino-4-hydroxy-6-hydroxymethyldihydropteridine diphosphokinase
VPAAAAPPVLAYVGLGANLGDARATLVAALDALRALDGVSALRASGFYRSAAVGGPGPDYVNAVAELRTVLSARALLTAMQRIEAAHGRTRSYRNAPRTLDLDLLLHGDAVLATPTLTLPHPRLHERAFVLVPLAEIAPDAVVPGAGRAADLLAGVAGQRLDKLGS